MDPSQQIAAYQEVRQRLLLALSQARPKETDGWAGMGPELVLVFDGDPYSLASRLRSQDSEAIAIEHLTAGPWRDGRPTVDCHLTLPEEGHEGALTLTLATSETNSRLDQAAAAALGIGPDEQPVRRTAVITLLDSAGAMIERRITLEAPQPGTGDERPSTIGWAALRGFEIGIAAGSGAVSITAPKAGTGGY